MPSQRPRASFEPIPPDFNLKTLVENTPNFSYVDRISCDMIDQQGLAAFEKLVLLHVIVGGKPLVIDGFDERLDPWTFRPRWLRDNCGEKVENARNQTSKDYLPLTMAHYLNNMGKLTNQFFDSPGAYKEKGRQRVYLKDIDCPEVWWDKLKEHIPSTLAYLNDNTGEVGGPGSVPDPQSNIPGRRLGKGIGRAGDLMSSLPPDMRAENLMCYIGHEGTYTPSHREMCASLGQNIMVEASGTVDDEGNVEKPGSSIWFMTESKDRHLVSEYWLSVLGHDIEVENHFAQVVAWKKAPFSVYVVEQRPGDFILIPPLAPHQVWNRGTRTMKVAWNRTTVETLEMALNEALPRSRIVCRDEQYKNKAIIYYTLQRYSSLLGLAQQQASRMPGDMGHQLMYTGKVKQLQKDFKRLFGMYREILLSEMFNPEERDVPKGIEYLPFDSNVTCAYCRGNVFNRFLSCGSCKDMLGHHVDDGEGDPYDVCMDCYAMGRSCSCISGLKWVEQFRWKELASKYETWRKQIIALDGGVVTEKTPLPLIDERRRYGKKTLAEVCRDQLKRRPFKDMRKSTEEVKSDGEEDEEIVVGDDGMVKKITKKKSKAWLKNNTPCHVCCHRHPNWRMAFCTTCDRGWCYGSLFRGWDKMPIEIMEDQNWSCPHCLGICFAGACKREGKMNSYEPKGTLLGHDTKKVADARSVEALVDFSVSNLNWLRDDDAVSRTESSRMKRAKADAQKAKENDPAADDDDEEHRDIDQSRVDYEYSPTAGTPIDPALTGTAPTQPNDPDSDDYFARRLQQATSSLPPPAAMVAGAPVNGAPDGYAPATSAGYVPPAAQMYNQTDENGYRYPEPLQPGNLDPVDRDSEDPVSVNAFNKRKRATEDDGDYEGDISMTKGKKVKQPRMFRAGFASVDLADPVTAPTDKITPQMQFKQTNEKKALTKAQAQGRLIMTQAAIKGKKRIVKLAIPGHRLENLVAQQTANAAQMAQAALAAGGDDADAAHEMDDRAAPQHGEYAVEPTEDLLKSDIAPKKVQNFAANYQRRQEEGHIVTGRSKKALIPVEKDENYGAYRPERKNPGVKSAASSKSKRKSKSNVDYEEVDIGSEAEDEEGGGFMAVNAPARHRRSDAAHGNARRHDGDEDLVNGLPENFRDHEPRREGAGAIRVRESPANRTETSPAVSQPTSSKPPAGKRPSMRPFKDSPAANGNSTATPSSTSTPNSARGTPTGAPSATTNGAPRPRSSLAKPASRISTPTAAAQRQAVIDDENRRAKLAMLKLVSDDAGGGASPNVKGKNVRFSAGTGGNNISLAQGLDEDLDDAESSDEDGIDSVPARGAVR